MRFGLHNLYFKMYNLKYVIHSEIQKWKIDFRLYTLKCIFQLEEDEHCKKKCVELV